MTIGDRIKQRREELGITQEELAQRRGYTSKSAVSRAETAGNNVGYKRIVKFADALGTTALFLSGWDTSKYEFKAFTKITEIIDIATSLDISVGELLDCKLFRHTCKLFLFTCIRIEDILYILWSGGEDK